MCTTLCLKVSTWCKIVIILAQFWIKLGICTVFFSVADKVWQFQRFLPTRGPKRSDISTFVAESFRHTGDTNRIYFFLSLWFNTKHNRDCPIITWKTVCFFNLTFQLENWDYKLLRTHYTYLLNLSSDASGLLLDVSFESDNLDLFRRW